MSTHLTYLPKKDTQPWRILKLLVAKAPLTSTEIAGELSLATNVTISALYILAHRYGLIYQGKSMSGYLLTKKGFVLARRLEFSGGKSNVSTASEAPKAPKAPEASKAPGPPKPPKTSKTKGRARAPKGGSDLVRVDEDLVRVIRAEEDSSKRKQDSKRKGMRAKRMGTQIAQIPSLPVTTVMGAGAGGAGGAKSGFGSGSVSSAFASEHPDLVKERAACVAHVEAIDAYVEAERAACLARVEAIDAYAEACEKFRASSLGG